MKSDNNQTLASWGWTSNLAELSNDDRPVGRVIETQYKRFLVATADREIWMTARSAMRLSARFPVLGDWVKYQGETIVELLPAQNEVSRLAAGESGDLQVLGSFVDWVFVVCAVDQGININKIERLALASKQSGAQVAIVITKSDLFEPTERTPVNPLCDADEIDQALSAPKDRQSYELALKSRLGQNVELIFTSHLADSNTNESATRLGRVRQLLHTNGRHLTGLLLGSSGAGKSSLVNALINKESQVIGGVRDRDGKGRHTTTVRRAFRVPTGGVIIDSPGLREMKLSQSAAPSAGGSDSALSDQFEDIESLALKCKFTTCSHSNEPGCKVQMAIRDGDLEPKRVASYTKLKKELAHQSRRAKR